MKHLRTNRVILGLGSGLAIVALAACDYTPIDNGGATPPPAPVVVPPPPPAPPDPPPVVVEEDCNALPVAAGTINCDDFLGDYCGLVFPADAQVPGQADPTQLANFQACVACDGTYATAIQGDCIEGGVPPVLGPQDESCYRCHAPEGYDGRNSVEDPHPWAVLSCTQCHGGDAQASNPAFAHVCPPPEVGNRQQQVFDTRAFFLSFTTAGVQLLDDYYCQTQLGENKSTSPLEYLAFLNPGDLRSQRYVDTDGNRLACANCHADISDAVSRNPMGNATGLNSGTRHGIGAQNKFAERNGNQATVDFGTMADYGATAITNPDYDALNRSVGEVPSLAQATVYVGEGFQFDNTYTADAVNNSLELVNTGAQNYPNGINNNIAENLFDSVLQQACTGCHLQNHYNNNRAGDYRGAGCSACHFETGVIGRSASQDPNVDKYEPIDPNFLTPGEKSWRRDHRIRNVAKVPGRDAVNAVVQGMSEESCVACHEGSNRTVAQYKGFRLDQNQDLNNANFYPSQNTVTFDFRAQLFGENNLYNNRVITQWIDFENWDADVADSAQQDHTPPDVHHEAGMGCVDCHGTGATHGRGEIMSRMKIQTHVNDVLCETCHGTIDEYAVNDGVFVLDQGNNPLEHITVNGAGLNTEFWLISKFDGSLHYIPQTKDTVDATRQATNVKLYPPGTPRAGQPIFSWVGSYSMGRYQRTQDLSDGMGPMQLNNANLQQVMRDNFTHVSTPESNALECYTCHSAWQNNCVGCHLDAFYDNNPNNFFYSQVTGERVYFNFNANFVYQNPIEFYMGVNDRGRITPYQGLARFFSYTDLNNNTSNRVSYGDRNGLGNDPQLRNPNRNNLPALQNQPFTPHSIRGRAESDAIGGRNCLDCHLGNPNALFATNEQNNTFDITDNYANNYFNSDVVEVQMAMGIVANIHLFDANGDAVFDTANAAAFDLSRIVEDVTGVTNSSSNHPTIVQGDPARNLDYFQIVDLNATDMARPLTQQVLLTLNEINNVYGGLSDVYLYSVGDANGDPNNTLQYNLDAYNYFQQ
jgi:hypothetical protein